LAPRTLPGDATALPGDDTELQQVPGRSEEAPRGSQESRAPSRHQTPRKLEKTTRPTRNLEGKGSKHGERFEDRELEKNFSDLENPKED